MMNNTINIDNNECHFYWWQNILELIIFVQRNLRQTWLETVPNIKAQIVFNFLFRKAIKATIVLLPLLGIANLVWLVPVPDPTEPHAWIVTYNYGLLFLDAYQGLLVGLFYCFLNTEVSEISTSFIIFKK